MSSVSCVEGNYEQELTSNSKRRKENSSEKREFLEFFNQNQSWKWSLQEFSLEFPQGIRQRLKPILLESQKSGWPQLINDFSNHYDKALSNMANYRLPGDTWTLSQSWHWCEDLHSFAKSIFLKWVSPPVKDSHEFHSTGSMSSGWPRSFLRCYKPF